MSTVSLPAVRKLKRAQILRSADAGAGDEEIARSVGVGGSTVYRTKRRFVLGNLEAGELGGHAQSVHGPSGSAEQTENCGHSELAFDRAERFEVCRRKEDEADRECERHDDDEPCRCVGAGTAGFGGVSNPNGLISSAAIIGPTKREPWKNELSSEIALGKSSRGTHAGTIVVRAAL